MPLPTFFIHSFGLFCLTGLSLPMTDKESANCRMEANYAHQQELDMIPLMMTEGFGWLRMALSRGSCGGSSRSST